MLQVKAVDDDDDDGNGDVDDGVTEDHRGVNGYEANDDDVGEVVGYLLERWNID